jgi:hypothetical protein
VPVRRRATRDGQAANGLSGRCASAIVDIRAARVDNYGIWVVLDITPSGVNQTGDAHDDDLTQPADAARLAMSHRAAKGGDAHDHRDHDRPR